MGSCRKDGGVSSPRHIETTAHDKLVGTACPQGGETLPVTRDDRRAQYMRGRLYRQLVRTPDNAQRLQKMGKDCRLWVRTAEEPRGLQV